MTNKLLVVYTTNAGSTEEVAQVIADELRGSGRTVDLHRVEEVDSLAAYEAVIVGAPMILGWHRSAISFVKKHREALAKKKVAYFCTAMSLTQTGCVGMNGVPVCVDSGLAKPPKREGHLGLKERYATLNNYLPPILKAAPAVKPLSVAFFGGKLEIFRLKWWQALFVMAIIQAPPGDLRNWTVIQAWAKELDSQI